MVGIALGLLYFNAGEWLLHKHVLHGLGRRRQSFWSFHWHNHHRNARRYGQRDPDYERPPFAWNGQGKEVAALLGIALMHLPLLPLAPFFTATVWWNTLYYYRVHKRSHLDPDWAREHLPWHVDHHLGPNQHANWCVTRPWFDVIMGTREPYVGTAREASDRARTARRHPSLRLTDEDPAELIPRTETP